MIPKKIHYCWVGNTEKPASVLYCIESWKKYCPDYEIIEWNESNYDFKKNGYMKEAYEAKKWGFVPDYARLDIIYQNGGIYLDTDVELIKSLDDLLDNHGFFGFEDTGEKNYFVACGLGFGAEGHNELIKKLRDYYDDLSFKNEDGTLNLTPAPRHNEKVFKEHGVIMNNMFQNIKGNIFYPAEYFCPKIFKTGKTTITELTHSIHHFSASWMDDIVRKDIAHNQAVCLRFGDRLGHMILRIESIWKKYGLFGLIKKILINGYECFISYCPLLMSILRRKNQKSTNLKAEIILFDTALYTKNCGDQIIMENCMKQLDEIINIEHAIHISTHCVPNTIDISDSQRKIVCGTNILSCNMRKYGLWKLPKNLKGFTNITLMGVGFDSDNMKYDLYTRLLFKYMFTKTGYHSVRDSFSEKCLKKMGISNVINTGCPTMWNLTKNHCLKIPHKKASKVVCTITDYLRDPINDKKMIQILHKNYETVYLWLQGASDLEYLKELDYEEHVILIPHSLDEYDKILQQSDLDYVGTRLHAGIRSLTAGHRTIIVNVDNRARNISKDTNLKIIERADVSFKLQQLILSEFETEIFMPWDNILKWKKQFW